MPLHETSVMRHRCAFIPIICVITSLAIFGADNSIGLWKMNFEKSSPMAAPEVRKSVSIVYEAIDGGIRATTKIEYLDGRTSTGGYTAKYDGKEYPTNLGRVDIISLRQVDANTFVIDERKKGGKRHQHGQKVISAGGKTMTFSVEGTDEEGNGFKSIWVYERQ
jgi:hypothetical protein